MDDRIINQESFKEDPSEFCKLADLLRQNNIPFELTDNEFSFVHMRRIFYQNTKRECLSVIFYPGSSGYRLGLLETWTMKKKDNPKGFRTAEEVFSEILSIQKGEENE